MRISDWSSDVCSSDLRIKLRLHANQTDIGFQGARRSAHARKEPTAADGNDQRVDLRRVLQHFKRDGALSGDDVGFIERMNEGQAKIGRAPCRTRVCQYVSY